MDTSHHALQLSWQGNEEHDSNKEADFELGCIKKALVTEPTHPTNSGPYYSAMADDVAQLVRHQGDFFFYILIYITKPVCLDFRSQFKNNVSIQYGIH